MAERRIKIKRTMPTSPEIDFTNEVGTFSFEQQICFSALPIGAWFTLQPESVADNVGWYKISDTKAEVAMLGENPGIPNQYFPESYPVYSVFSKFCGTRVYADD